MSRRYTLLYIIPLLASILSLFSCQSDDPVLSLVEWRLTATDNNDLRFANNSRYYQFTVCQEGTQDTALIITTDADWLTLTTDKLPTDGIVEFYATANKSINERSATIRFASTVTPEHTAVIVVRQQGFPMTASNDGDNDPQKDYGIGWGFNAYQDFQSSKSVVGKVINEQALLNFDSDTTFNSFQESVRGSQSLKVYSAHSLQEMSSTLTRTMESSVNILFYKKTTKRFEKVSTYSTAENLFAYARMTNTVASRSIDKGVLEYLAGRGETSIFTAQFREIYHRIVQAKGAERISLIKEMLTQYGTHIITEASIGGMIDYAVTFDRNIATTLEATSENYCSYFFGQRSKSESDKSQEYVTSSINNDYAIHISGGESKVRDKLLASAKSLKTGDHLNIDDLREWTASINYNCLYDEERRADLDIVDFHFLPIWKVFADKETQNAVFQQVIEMGANSNCAFSDEELGTDNYMISNIAQYDNFDTEPTATLVKVLYNNNVPIVEICNEYVPKIRTDKRITVFYPIKDGRTRIGQGIFPGDGEGNPPALLTFSEGDCYVNPIEGYGYNDRLTELYYLHGNLYTEDYGTALNRLRATRVRDQYLSLPSSQYPIVKIGAGYWSRAALKKVTSLNLSYAKQVGDVFFVRVFYDKGDRASPNCKEVFGDDRDELLGYRTKWYYPTKQDITDLYTYIGKNSKSMMKGQASGFEADFLGNYQIYDDFTNRSLDNYQTSYRGEYTFIPCREDRQADCISLTLSKGYQLGFAKQSASNYYPVRLFRTSYFRY